MQTEKGEEITAGSWWFVRYPLEHEVALVYVSDVTGATVEVEPAAIGKRKARYEHGYLKFIERTSYGPITAKI